MFLSLIAVHIITSLLLSVAASNNATLIEAIRKVAGVYRHMPQSNASNSFASHINLALDKTVLLTVANFGFLNHLQNFLCFTERLSMEPLIVSMDENLHSYLTNRTSYVSYLFDTTGKTNLTVKSDAAGWRSQQFNLISNLKIVAALEVMKLGYNVLFADPDVAIVRDPVPFLYWKNVDYVHSLNFRCNSEIPWKFFKDVNTHINGNTGFYYSQSNNQTIALFEASVRAASEFPDRDDQTVFWNVARRIRHPTMQHIGECPNYTRKDDINTVHHLRFNATNVVACALDPCMFSSGMVEGGDRAGNPRYSVLKYFLHKKNSSIHSVHANWIIGSTEKMLALKSTGLWIAKENVEQSFGPKNCLPFVEKAGTIVRSPSPSDRSAAKHTQHASHSSELHTTHDSSHPPSNSVPLQHHVRINLPVH